MLKSVPNASIHIPDHTIIEKIGSGGMSSVYLGRQISLQRKVAIKVLKTLVMDDQDLAERFVNEAKTIASLDHPHIISIYEAKKLPSGLTYFTMPYLNHGNFGDIICTNADHLIDLLSQICDGLAFAHDRGVIHRDLKPDNILFDQFGQIKIADFGIALSPDSKRRTKDEQILGSAHFMSPEQIQSRDINYLSDIYSLGCIIYEKLTGDHVYEANNDFAVLLAHINKPIPELPKALAKWQPILNKCLAKKVEDRYQSAQDVKADLLNIRSPITHHSTQQKRQPLSLPAWLKPWQVGAVCGALVALVLAAVYWPDSKPVKHSLPVSTPSTLDNTIESLEPQSIVDNTVVTPMMDAVGDLTLPTTSTDNNPLTINVPQAVSLDQNPSITEVSIAAEVEADLDPEIEEPLEDGSSALASTETENLLTNEGTEIDINNLVIFDETGQAIDPPENYIDLLLADGQSLLKKYRLTKPAGDSAIDRFKAVLKIDPENLSAREGMNQIARNYFKLVQSKRKAGDMAKAKTYAQAMVNFMDAENIDRNIFTQSFEKLMSEAKAQFQQAVESRRANPEAETLWALATVFINNDDTINLSEQYQAIPSLGDVMPSQSEHTWVFVPSANPAADFLVMQNEVTLGQFEAFAGEQVSKDRCVHLGGKGIFKKYSWKKPPFDQTAQHPVICVTATEAQAYANWLSEQTGQTYRLPTASEWQQLNQVAANDNQCQLANLAGQETSSKSKITKQPFSCSDKNMYTSAVGSYAGKNQINDINGNIAEWTLDCTSADACTQFGLAGNSWQSGQGATNSLIQKMPQDTRVSYAGFRLVRTID